MKRFVFILFATILLAGLNAFAQGKESEPGAITEAEIQEITRGYLGEEMFSIKPQLGVTVFTDYAGMASRFAEGFTADANFSKNINKDWTHLFIGPSTGFIFSHIGDPTSNLAGLNPYVSVGNAGANIFFVPLNLKVGYNLTDRFRVAAHGGGTLLYRSIANSMPLGAATSTGTGANLVLFPNIGADADLAMSKQLALSFRPDLTVIPGNNIFTGTVALSFIFA